MTFAEIMTELKNYGDEQTKMTLMRHGGKEPIFGVKIADLKKILKKTKKNHALSLELYNTGNSDAMYLAGLMADENQITREQLEEWATKAYWYFLSEYTVPWVAAETKFGFELGIQWINSDQEHIEAAGWSTLAYNTAVNEDETLDIETYKMLLDKVANEIHIAKNRVKYAMNNFVISVGTYVSALTEKSQEVANRIGKVEVQMGGTACKVPLAKTYIQKSIDKGKIGKKRKTARC